MRGKISGILASALILNSAAFAKKVEEETCEARIDPVLDAALAAGPYVEAYFKAAKENLVERDDLVDLAELALVAKEHLLLMGPPGNAKSMLAHLILAHIMESITEGGATTYHPSYFKIVLNPESTTSDTHGPMNFPKLQRKGVWERLYHEGMLKHRLNFIDEIFDARKNARRNILEAINERTHSQGARVEQGKIETVIAATNKYLSQVFEEAGDDSPLAVVDRFALSSFVSGEFEYADSYSKIIAGHTLKPMPQLTFAQLEAVRALIPRVVIPDYVNDFLNLLAYRFKIQTEALQEASLKNYKEKLQLGELVGPPYRATKYQSPRTLGKAARILRAQVAIDWVKSGGKRRLSANLLDLKGLRRFFTLNGPNDAFIQVLKANTTNPHEQAQIAAILRERELFDEIYNGILTQANSAPMHQELLNIESDLKGTPDETEKLEISKRLLKIMFDIIPHLPPALRQIDLGGSHIGAKHVRTFAEETLKEMLGDRYEAEVGSHLRRIEEEHKHAEVAAARKKQEEEESKRLAAAKEAEEERRRAAVLAQRQNELKHYFEDESMIVPHQALLDSGNGAPQAFSAMGGEAVFTQKLASHNKLPGTFIRWKSNSQVSVDANSIRPTDVDPSSVRYVHPINETDLLYVAGNRAYVNRLVPGAGFKLFKTFFIPAEESPVHMAIEGDGKHLWVVDRGPLPALLRYDLSNESSSPEGGVHWKDEAQAAVAKEVLQSLGTVNALGDTFRISADGKTALIWNVEREQAHEVNLTTGEITTVSFAGRAPFEYGGNVIATSVSSDLRYLHILSRGNHWFGVRIIDLKHPEKSRTINQTISMTSFYSASIDADEGLVLISADIFGIRAWDTSSNVLMTEPVAHTKGLTTRSCRFLSPGVIYTEVYKDNAWHATVIRRSPQEGVERTQSALPYIGP